MQRKWQVLLVTSVAVFMSFLDVTIVNIAFPDIRSSFHSTSLAGLSWILNAYNIVFAALLVPAGRLADRAGRRRTFLAGLVTFLAASVAAGLAPSVPVLVAARVVQAAGAAALVPTSLALLLPEFPLQQRATATGIWGAMGGIGAALLVGGVALLSLGIVKGQDWGWGGGRVVGTLAAATALLVLFAIRSSRHPAPVVEAGLFRVRSFAVANAGAFAFALGFYAFLLGNVLFLTGPWHYSILTAGFAMTPGPLMAAVGAVAGGRPPHPLGPRAGAP